jgi:signal transduction histidine kinase
MSNIPFSQFRRFAQAMSDIQGAADEADALAATAVALEASGFKELLVSLYKPGSQLIRDSTARGASWKAQRLTAQREDEGSAIAALVRQSDKPELLLDPERDPRCSAQIKQGSGIRSQYVVPIRLDTEIIGTFQINMKDKTFVADDEAVVLDAFAVSLAATVSRIRSMRSAQELTSHIMASSRFILAESLSAMIAHSIRHKLADFINRLEDDLKRKEVRENRPVFALLSGWRNLVSALQEDLTGTLRFMGGRESERVAPTDLRNEIQQVIDLLIGLLVQNRAKVTVRFEAAKDSRSSIHPSNFREILMALLVNSVQAHAKQIEVRTYSTEGSLVSVSFVGKALCLECKDDGTGLATDVPEQVFEARYTTKAQTFGTGLGLFIARRLARESGGELMIVDHGPRQKGTTFRLVLPAVTAKPTKPISASDEGL